MDKNSIQKEKETMITQIKQYCPIFKPFFELDISLNEYTKTVYNFKFNEVYIERQKQVKEKILKKFKKLFGENVKERFKINFNEQMAINIVDHHQVLNHPLLITDNIIANADKLFKTEKQDAIIVISSGDVPPNNYFSKNGFEFHGKRIPIFSTSEREKCSYYISKRDFNFIDKLKNIKRWPEFTKSEQEFLEQEYNKIKSLDFSTCENYIDQISMIVNNSWPFLFEEKLRKNLPELLYITQEELTTECLIDLLKEDNYVTQALFDKSFREKILNNFRGIVVTWNEKEGKGTHFFWRKHPEEEKSIRMYLEGNKLVPHDSRYKDLAVNLDKNELIDLLKKKEIYPSLFMIFSVLNFYHGVKPLVGQGSIIYLNLFRDMWLKTLKDVGYKNEIDNILSYEIDKMISGLALFFKREKNKLKTLYAYDIFYEGGIKEEHLKKVLSMKFKDLLSISVVGIYDYISQKYIPDKVKIKPIITSDDLAQIYF